MTAPITSTELDMWERDLHHAQALDRFAAHDLQLADLARDAATIRRTETAHRDARRHFAALTDRYTLAFGVRAVASVLGLGADSMAALIADYRENRYMVVRSGEYGYVPLDPTRPLGQTWSGAWSQGVR